MLFNSITFLFVFMPFVFILAKVFDRDWIPQCFKNLILLLASLLFYLYSGVRGFLVLLLSILFNYIFGLLIERSRERTSKKLLLAFGVGVDILILLFFKTLYIVKERSGLFVLQDAVIPVGLSFFTFQAVSYLIDVYRGDPPLKNLVDMGLYISFFPQLIAGPIVRYNDIREEIHTRNMTAGGYANGVWRFAVGLNKKVLLANVLGELADIVFANVDTISILYSWLGVISYTLQIYFDFSGYSDMAIGLGEIFGFHFKENFNLPYTANSAADFWRRWHISLSSWFKDYVYIPLGGNRMGRFRTAVNLLIVWVLTSLWHGIKPTFFIWGMGWACLIIVERFIIKPWRFKGIVKVIYKSFILIVVMLLWVPFRSDDITQMYMMIRNMFIPAINGIAGPDFWFHAKSFAFVLLLGFLMSTRFADRVQKKMQQNTVIGFAGMIVLATGTVLSVLSITAGSYDPFLYYMF